MERSLTFLHSKNTGSYISHNATSIMQHCRLDKAPPDQQKTLSCCFLHTECCRPWPVDWLSHIKLMDCPFKSPQYLIDFFNTSTLHVVVVVVGSNVINCSCSKINGHTVQCQWIIKSITSGIRSITNQEKSVVSIPPPSFTYTNV